MAVNQLCALFAQLMIKYKFKGPNGDNLFEIKQKFGLIRSIQPTIGLTIEHR